VITPNESTWFLNGIIIAASVLNIWYIIAIRRYNKKTRQLKNNDTYIAHLETLIEQYERITKRQNNLLDNGNDTAN